jgi:DNA-directed RNA polymerase specialized sigma24 family protein
MEDLTATEIAQITGAATGIANRFVKYAKEDLAKLLKAANKRARN